MTTDEIHPREASSLLTDGEAVALDVREAWEWQRGHIILSFLSPPSTTAEQAHEAARRREAIVLDVRERHEWKAGHAPGAKNIPLSKLPGRIGELRADQRYIAVCRSGSRSRSAVAQLRRAGLDAVNLKGGMHGWKRAGLPLEPRNGRIA